MTKKDDGCEKKHVMVKDGCKLVRRIVYSAAADKKFIKLEGKDVLLSALRGKFRYTH